MNGDVATHLDVKRVNDRYPGQKHLDCACDVRHTRGHLLRSDV